MTSSDNPGITEPAMNVGNLPKGGAWTKRFRLRLSLPGHDLKGEWVGRLTGAAMAYQYFCGTYGDPRIFTWYEWGGYSYLVDQEGYYLSWEGLTGCVEMRTWDYAAPWKLEGGRLVAAKANYVLSWTSPQHWTFADETFLLVAEPGPGALTVEEIDEEPTPVQKILDVMVAVYQREHKADGVDRYVYGTRTVLDHLPDAEKQQLDPRAVAFFGVKSPVGGSNCVGVNLLEMSPTGEQRTYYRLSVNTQDDGYSLVPNPDPAGPVFYAFADEGQLPDYLVQVYEHAAETPTGKHRYIYDFTPAAHDGWSPGNPVFRAVSPKEAEEALISSLGSQSARAYALAWANKNGDAITDMVRGVTKGDVDSDFAAKFGKYLEGLPDPQFYTLGAGFHGGYGLGTAGFEAGSMWTAENFGYVPMRQKLQDYSVEWVSFGGATGVDIGASVDAFSFGVWFGDISPIEGACNGITISGQYFAGLTLNLLWDGSWQGADYSPHPIGVSVILSVGLEAGGGVFYNASATQFWNRQSALPPP